MADELSHSLPLEQGMKSPIYDSIVIVYHRSRCDRIDDEEMFIEGDSILFDIDSS